MTVTIEAPCRKCKTCLKRRAAHWRLRAMGELGASKRTWFCTFTFTPAQHVRFANQARSWYAKALEPQDFDAMSVDEQFIARHDQAKKELTLFFKRLRARTGVTFTYLLVVEAHASGLPHYHALIHEKDEPVRHADMKSCWSGGHALFKLCVDPRQAAYVTKYISKSALARVRASLLYGSAEAVPDVLEHSRLPKEAASDP